MSTKKSISLTYLLCFISLLFGLFVYLFYRTEDTIICRIFTNVFSNGIHNDLSSYFSNTIPLSTLSIYSLPAGLWVMSATMITFGKRISVFGNRYNLAFLPLIYGIGLEFIQALHITNGTFDLIDIAFVCVFWLIGFIYVQQIPSRIKNLSMSSKYVIASYLVLFLADTIV